jgi:hypothetical protein
LKAKFFATTLVEQTFKYNETSIRLNLVRTLPELKSSQVLAKRLLQVTPWQFLKHPKLTTDLNQEAELVMTRWEFALQSYSKNASTNRSLGSRRSMGAHKISGTLPKYWEA